MKKRKNAIVTRMNSDIPFATDDAHAFLPWVISIMACIAALLLCLGVTLGSWIIDRSHNYAGNFTVNIPASASADSGKIENELQQIPGVANVSQVDAGKLRNMLSPWLGTGVDATDLPLPTVINVKMNDKAALDYRELQTRLAAIVPGVEVDAHEQWIASFSQFSRSLQWLTGSLAALIVSGLALMIAFTSRASLKLHAKTVQLLHSMGAEDRYITRQFQREAFFVTLRGSLPGCLAAGAAYWAGGHFMTQLDNAVLPDLAMNWLHVETLALMPLACGLVAWITARFSVLQLLRHRL